MLKVCGVAHTNYFEGDLKLYVGEAKRVGERVYFYDGTNLYRLTHSNFGCSVKIEFAKVRGADDQDFFLCWVNDIDSDTVWFDGSITDFDRLTLCYLREFL